MNGVVNVYPVGILRELKDSWKARAWRISLSDIFWMIVDHDWPSLFVYFHDGYHAIPAVWPEGLKSCGSGWTRKRALRNLYKRMGVIESSPRIERLRSGNWQFGCRGYHHGIGRPNCPVNLHHHHDEFCQDPTEGELLAAGINPRKFAVRSRV